MAKNRIRLIAWVFSPLLAVALAPGESGACEWLDNLMPWNWCRNNDTVAASTTYCPPYAPVAAPAVAAPASCTTCSYIPQTFYRTAYQTVPVTSCCPVVTCDPCTGCPCTAYQPVTSMVRQARLVPYTTYQAVYAADPCTSCAPVATAAPASSDCCGSTTPYYAPSQAAPATPIPASPIPATPTPALDSGAAPTTQMNDPAGTRRSYQLPADANPPETRFKPPVPTEEEKAEPTAPALIGPTSNTAMLGARQAAYLQPISSARVSTSDGWRASRD